MNSHKNRPWPVYVLLVAAVTLAVLAVAQVGLPTSSARTSTQIVTAANGVVQSTVSGTGNVEAGTDLDVNFQTTGTLSKVDVKAGQHVSKGQLLATLDRERFHVNELEHRVVVGLRDGGCDDCGQPRGLDLFDLVWLV